LCARLGDTLLAAGQPDEARRAWQDSVGILDRLDQPTAEIRAKLRGLG